MQVHRKKGENLGIGGFSARGRVGGGGFFFIGVLEECEGERWWWVLILFYYLFLDLLS